MTETCDSVKLTQRRNTVLAWNPKVVRFRVTVGMRAGREKRQSSLGKCAGDSEEQSEAACFFPMLHSWGVSLGEGRKGWHAQFGTGRWILES